MLQAFWDAALARTPGAGQGAAIQFGRGPPELLVGGRVVLRRRDDPDGQLGLQRLRRFWNSFLHGSARQGLTPWAAGARNEISFERLLPSVWATPPGRSRCGPSRGRLVD